MTNSTATLQPSSIVADASTQRASSCDSPRPSPARLQVAGTLRDDALYIEREADTELFELLLSGEFCSVLAPRQIGKSSLRHRTARRLANAGVRCVEIDITALGKTADREPINAWYFSLACQVSDQLELCDPRDFFQSRSGLLPADTFCMYLKQLVLPSLPGLLVLFLDEIDYLRALPAPFDRDEFLVALRALYNERAGDAALARLRICLLGVVSPRDLVKDPGVTPFNIGRAVRLYDFNRKQLEALSPSLLGLSGRPEEWIDAIHSWTGGHPYLTQALCQELLWSSSNSGSIATRVEQAVTSRFLLNGRSLDDSLSYAEKRLEQSEQRAELLALYRRLLDQCVPLDEGDPVQQELQLCGLAAPDSTQSPGIRFLMLRNRVFAQVFDREWLAEKEAKHKLRQATQRWLSGTERMADTLLRGAELADVERWAAEHGSQVTQDENLFLRACLDGARRQAEDARLASEARVQRLQSRFSWALVVVLLAGLLVVFKQYQNANHTARLEKSLRAAAMATQPGNGVQSLILAMQAVQPRTGQDSIGTIWEGLYAAAASITMPDVVLAAHAGSVVAASFSPDGREVVTASEDRTARIWDVENQTVRAVLSGHTHWLADVVFSPDGKRVLTASWDKTARIWDTTTGQQLLALQDHTDGVSAARFSEDGQRIVTGCRDGIARVFDAMDGRLLHELRGHNGLVLSVGFSPDGTRIVTGSIDKSARVWDASDGRQLFSLSGHSERLSSVVFSRDGQRIVTGSWDRTARIWDGKSGSLLRVLAGHMRMISAVDFSPDRSMVVTASFDRTALFWNAETGTLMRMISGHDSPVTSARFSQDGRRVLTASYDQTARVWSTVPRATERLIVTLAGHEEWVLAARFSPDGLRILTTGRDRRAVLWDARTGQQIGRFGNHLSEVRGADFASDGTRIVTATADGRAYIFDVQTGVQVRMLSGEGSLVSARFSPDNRRIITASFDNNARIWDAETGRHLETLSKHKASLTSAVFSPDGRLIATSGHDGVAKLYDAATGNFLRDLSGHRLSVQRVEFSPDSTRVVTASRDKSARIWSTTTGEALMSLEGHSDWVRDANYSKNGKWIVTASADRTAKVWDAHNGRLLLTLAGHSDFLTTANFSPDGNYVVTASDDRTARVHPLNTEELYSAGCRFLRTLSNHPDVELRSLQQLISTCP